MSDKMEFPKTFMEFLRQYDFKDTEQVYTNGSCLIPEFRVYQMWDHVMDQFREAYEISHHDLHTFGHYCKKILKDLDELY